VGLYLWWTNWWFKMHDNEAFSAIHHEGFKNFLRIRIDASGLTLHAIGLEKIGGEWDPSKYTGTKPCKRPAEAVPRVIDHIHLPPSEAATGTSPV
jgi:hypothetical protein